MLFLRPAIDIKMKFLVDFVFFSPQIYFYIENRRNVGILFLWLLKKYLTCAQRRSLEDETRIGQLEEN